MPIKKCMQKTLPSVTIKTKNLTGSYFLTIAFALMEVKSKGGGVYSGIYATGDQYFRHN